MTPEKARLGEGRNSISKATEPRSYDRRFYARVLIVGLILILISIGVLVYDVAFKTVEPPKGPTFDLESLFMKKSRLIPDPKNPCIIIQEHLEATRTGSYRLAYSYLSRELKKLVSLEEFAANADDNSILLRDVKAYKFPDYTTDGAAASASGFLEYNSGGKSKIDAVFIREGDSWKISGMTLIFE